jgi:hypothetical protein
MPSIVAPVVHMAVLHGSLSLEGVQASLLEVLTGSSEAQSVLDCAGTLLLLDRC